MKECVPETVDFDREVPFTTKFEPRESDNHVHFGFFLTVNHFPLPLYHKTK
jgi:hypothetical protein